MFSSISITLWKECSEQQKTSFPRWDLNLYRLNFGLDLLLKNLQIGTWCVMHLPGTSIMLKILGRLNEILYTYDVVRQLKKTAISCIDLIGV